MQGTFRPCSRFPDWCRSATLTHVSGVSQRIAPRLMPDRKSVRLLPDGNLPDLPGGRVHHIDDVVVAPRQPELLAVRRHVAHVGTATPGDRPRRHDAARAEVDDGHAPGSAGL